MGIRESAKTLGIEFERPPQAVPAVTAYAEITALGNANETFQGRLQGVSGTKPYDVHNFRSNLAAPIRDPYESASDRERKLNSPVQQIAINLVLEAGQKAGILDEEGHLQPAINRRRVGVCIGTGIGSTAELIDVYNKIHHSVDKDTGEKLDARRGSRKVMPYDGLRLFTEEINAKVAATIGASGWPINTSEACATGAASIVEACRLVKEGRMDIVIAGGVEYIFDHPEVAMAIFAATRGALSKNNEEAETASRPYDVSRDGFVMSSGGGIVIIESLAHAQKRNANIQALVIGFEKSIDGDDPTNMDPQRGAVTIAQALYDQDTQEFHNVDVIVAHGTSTENGDVNETNAFRQAFEEEIFGIPITSQKGNLGHPMGAAGATNAIEAIQIINSGLVPPVANLKNIDPKVVDLNIVQGKPLEREIKTAISCSFGFGGHNAVLVFEKYDPAKYQQAA